jgi:hypothetical protein
MIVPYGDAAALMLANLDRGSATARHRVGLALPAGMMKRLSRGRDPSTDKLDFGIVGASREFRINPACASSAAFGRV